MLTKAGNQVLLASLVLVIAILTLISAYRAVNFSDFSLHENGKNPYVDLANNRYLELTQTNDHLVSIQGTHTINPFSDQTSNSSLLTGIDFGNLNREYGQTTTSDQGKRNLTFSRIDATHLKLDFDIELNYPANSYRTYTLQVNYSAIPQQTYLISQGIRLVDAGCTIDITDNQTASYDTFNQDRTILINIPYSPIMRFRISMHINCNQ